VPGYRAVRHAVEWMLVREAWSVQCGPVLRVSASCQLARGSDAATQPVDWGALALVRLTGKRQVVLSLRQEAVCGSLLTVLGWIESIALVSGVEDACR
jgi:hypothetical protein